MAINRKEQKAAIFLTNRTYAYDDRPLWIEERQRISQWIQQIIKNRIFFENALFLPTFLVRKCYNEGDKGKGGTRLWQMY